MSFFRVPEYAPLWLNLGYGRILHVFKLQVFLEFGLIYAHRHRHVSIAVQGSMGSACKPLAPSPEVMTGCQIICTYLLLIDMFSHKRGTTKCFALQRHSRVDIILMQFDKLFRKNNKKRIKMAEIGTFIVKYLTQIRHSTALVVTKCEAEH